MLYTYKISNTAKKMINKKTIGSSFPKAFIALVNAYNLDKHAINGFLSFLQTIPHLCNQINQYYNKKNNQILLLVYKKETQELRLILSDNMDDLYDIGEKRSVLSYLRSYGLKDNVICSDCYGEMACSSCLISIKEGQPENPTIQQEEIDMFDTDSSIINKTNKRLGCQVKVAAYQPLAVWIGND